jgi:integrase
MPRTSSEPLSYFCLISPASSHPLPPQHLVESSSGSPLGWRNSGFFIQTPYILLLTDKDLATIINSDVIDLLEIEVLTMHGDGTVFKRGNVWWMQFSHKGRVKQISAKTTSKDEAKARLKHMVRKIRGENGDGFFASLLPGQATVGEIVADLFEYYSVVRHKLKFCKDSRRRWELHMKAIFDNAIADSVTNVDLRDYRKMRTQEEGASPTTVNREIQVLSAAYDYARKQDSPKVFRSPFFEWSPEHNARQVFIPLDVEEKIKAAAAKRGIASRAWVELGFRYGWRDGEVRSLTPANINLAENTLRIATSKNGLPREVPIDDDGLRVLLTALVTGKAPNERLFTFSRDREWKSICQLAGVHNRRKGGYTYHDTRRSSARNKRAAGVSQTVTMDIMGWSTASMFKRYAITDRNDMLDAIRKEKLMRAEAAEAAKTQSN